MTGSMRIKDESRRGCISARLTLRGEIISIIAGNRGSDLQIISS